MPRNNDPSMLVARFLKSNNYHETYDAFISEAGLSFDSGSIKVGDLTLEKLLDEKRAFDVSSNFEKLGLAEAREGWREPAPSLASDVRGPSAMANILSITALASSDAMGDTPMNDCLFITAADRRLDIFNIPQQTITSTSCGLQDSPILSCATVLNKYLLTTSMSGQVVLSDFQGNKIDSRRDHNKYVVKVIVHETDTDIFMATASWDGKVFIYKIRTSEDGTPAIGSPVSEIKTATKPETILFVKHPENGQPVLVLTRSDSSFLYYYYTQPYAMLLGRQNLAPHSNAWVAFTPSAIAQSPADPTLLAVALSTLPHMKLAVVRMLIPPLADPDLPQSVDSAATPASQAHRELALAEKEHAAIQILCNTMAPQTAYSTPALAWRPDASGVWVNGDDGVIRGIEAHSGKVVATLKGHDPGTKVRCIWAGQTPTGEVLVSGGFDQKLLIWSVQSG